MRPQKIALLNICIFGWLLILAPGASSAAVPTPHWSVSIYANANLEPGSPAAGQYAPTYFIFALNDGAADTVGPFRLTDRLPAGLSIPPESPLAELTVEPPSVTCVHNEVAGQTVISCEGTESLQPGKRVIVRIPVAVDPSASDAIANEASMEGGGAPPASVDISTPVTFKPPNFDFLPEPDGAALSAYDVQGNEAVQAGSHPSGALSTLALLRNHSVDGDSIRLPNGGAKNLAVNLPKGFVVNPTATAKCTEAQLEHETACPPNSQVGTVQLQISLFGVPGRAVVPLFNLKPAPGVPAEFGFRYLGLNLHILGKVRSETDYGLTGEVDDVSSKVGVLGAEVELWGTPSASVHDAMRGTTCSRERSYGEECPLNAGEAPGGAFISLSTSCGPDPLVGSADATSWESPTVTHESRFFIGPIRGCDRLGFDPSISSKATSGIAESPTGLTFSLHVPQASGSAASSNEELATANLKDVTVTLPQGLVVNPSAANGLESCTASEIGLATPVGQAAPVHFSNSRVECPAASSLGSVEVRTPLLEGPLTGSLYLAKPFENPFASLIAVYLSIDDETTGIVAKLPGVVEPDPATGRLTVKFTENPELPIEDVSLVLPEGPRATLTTPLPCGTGVTVSTLTPWSAPEGADAHPSATSTTIGPRCATSEAAATRSYDFSAGAESSKAGVYSPFSLSVSRADASQHLTGVDTTLPEGLLGRLAGFSYCPAAGIARAQNLEAIGQGGLEQQEPSCPKSSEVGTVTIAAGSGPSPLPISGRVYLAGPYRDAPISLVVIVPAVAGPFDLGNVVDRVALDVDPYDTRVHASADPIPTIRAGVPFDLRSIELKLNAKGFTLNPTSCGLKQIDASLSTQAGQTTPLSKYFEADDCERLAFRPSLHVSLKGATARTGHPALKAVVTLPNGDGYANISRAQVNLPRSEFLDQGNVAKACTKVLISQRACPPRSIYGRARAWSPLLDKPLEGPVYLAGGYGYKLPALVAELGGQIRVLLVGRVDTGKNHGIRTTFESVPDAPVEKFVLELKGGKKYGLLENSEDLCRRTQNAGTVFRAQNGRVKHLTSKISNSCQTGSARKRSSSSA